MTLFKIHPKINIALFTVLHFIVDGICGLVIFSSLILNQSDDMSFAILITYNLLAFVTQPFVGLLIDIRDNQERLFLLISVFSLALGICFKSQPLISAVFLGIGNSFFHISGGKYTIRKTGNDIFDLGLFVSTGAVGLAIGCNFNNVYVWSIFVSLLFLISFLIIFSKDSKNITSDKNICKNEKLSKKAIFLLFLLICIAVLIRSFIGKIVNYSFDKTALILVLFGLDSTLGKALGGAISKAIGINKTIIITMIASTILFIFSNDNVYLSLLAILFFNMSMPLTLYLANCLVEKEGFAFGMLAAFLIPGYLLGMFSMSETLIKILIATSSLITAAIVVIANSVIKSKRKSVL